MMNNRGFTLMELMIGAALVGIVSLTGTAVLQNFNKATLQAESKHKQIQLQKELVDSLSNKDTCADAFPDRNFVDGVDSDVRMKLPNGTIVSHRAGENRPPQFMTEVTSLKMINKTQTAVLGNGNRVFSAQVQLGSRNPGDQQVFRPVPVATLNLQVTPAGVIENCRATIVSESSVNFTCTGLGGVVGAGGFCREPAGRTAVTCPAGQYLQGFNTDGVHVCRTVPPPPPPPPPACVVTEQSHGMGLGSSPRVFGMMGCTYSCTVAFGNNAYCAGGCFSGYRGWLYCGDCRSKTTCP